MLLFQVSAPHLSITPGSGSLRSLFSDQFLGTVMLSDVTVIVSRRNADINLMLAKKKELHQMHLRAPECVMAHGAVSSCIFHFSIFQGPPESLMLYADALHRNYRSH